MEGCEDVPGWKTLVDLLASERDGTPRRIFQGRRLSGYSGERKMEDRDGSSRVKILGGIIILQK